MHVNSRGSDALQPCTALLNELVKHCSGHTQTSLTFDTGQSGRSFTFTMVLRHTGTSAERILKDRRLFLEFFYLHFNDFTIVSLRLINDYKSCSTIIFSLKTKKTKNHFT